MPVFSDLDALSQLVRPSWRGIPFDIIAFEMSGDHDHTTHKAPDRDGGLTEATGRNPFSWRFSAIFRNGVVGSEGAYPKRWREFVKACADRSPGTLLHPELGELKAKCKSFPTTWDSARRDGVDMQLEFVEATDDDSVLVALDKIGSTPFAQARSLDDALGAMNPQPSLPEELSPSLLDSINRLSGLAAQARLSLGNLTAQIDSMAGAITNLREQIEAFDNPAHHGALAACDALFAALFDLGESLSERARPFAPAIVQNAGTLAAVAAYFGNSLEDFLRLNPLLASKTSVDSGTQVFVYVA